MSEWPWPLRETLRNQTQSEFAAVIQAKGTIIGAKTWDGMADSQSPIFRGSSLEAYSKDMPVFENRPMMSKRPGSQGSISDTIWELPWNI